MSKQQLTYYFSTGSRYSYLSMSQMPLIEQRHGVQFDWVPVNGKRIRSLRGADPFQGAPQSGQYDWAYREKDAKAWAEYYGVKFNEPPEVEFDVECLLRGVIAAGYQRDIRQYAWVLAQEVFARRAALSDSGTVQALVERVAGECDLDVARLVQDCQAHETQQQLEQNCEEAVVRGAFGTPSLFIGDELFWGNDRLRLLEFRLAQLDSAERQIAAVRLDHVVLRSPTPELLVDFYAQVFGTTVERQVKDFLWQLRIGDGLLDIIRTDSSQDGPGNMDHFCVTVRDFDAQRISAHLAALGVDADLSDNIYGAEGFGPSVYFSDPQGNRVELKVARRGV